MEEQTLHYYLKVFSIIILIFLILFFFYIFNALNKNLIFYDSIINIKKGESIDRVIKKNITNFTFIDILLIKIYIKTNKIIFHYGDFDIDDDMHLLEFIHIISKPSNILNKITIVEGWSQKQLNLELAKHFKEFDTIPYEDIIADTYFFQKNISFDSFLKKLHKIKFNYFNNYLNNPLQNKYTKNQIMIIGSILEKEGLDKEDKKNISSVIFNRLNKNMKLQIDATVLFSLTDGKYDLGRKLLLSDLKINHPFNTYINVGLPPGPISYVGKNTLDIVFENYETDFLFYFFNNSLNSHVFSKNFKDHKEKLNEYRK